MLLRRSREAQADAVASSDPCSPWNLTSGWRLNSDNFHDLIFLEGEETVKVTAHYRTDGYLLDLPNESLLVRGDLDASGDLSANIDGTRIKATVVRHAADMIIMGHGFNHRLTVHDPYAQSGEQSVDGGKLTAPMPGKVIAVLVEAGAKVTKGAPLMILEAMKMEHTVLAPEDGIIDQANFQVGDQVGDGDELLTFAAAEDT